MESLPTVKLGGALQGRRQPFVFRSEHGDDQFCEVSVVSGLPNWMHAGEGGKGWVKRLVANFSGEP